MTGTYLVAGTNAQNAWLACGILLKSNIILLQQVHSFVKRLAAKSM